MNPSGYFVVVAVLVIAVYFHFEKDREPLIASQARIALTLLCQPAMLTYFISSRKIAERFKFHYESLEAVLDDFVIQGKLERRHRNHGFLGVVELYRWKRSDAQSIA
jgi:hypothetical protein